MKCVAALATKCPIKEKMVTSLKQKLVALAEFTIKRRARRPVVRSCDHDFDSQSYDLVDVLLDLLDKAQAECDHTRHAEWNTAHRCDAQAVLMRIDGQDNKSTAEKADLVTECNTFVLGTQFCDIFNFLFSFLRRTCLCYRMRQVCV